MTKREICTVCASEFCAKHHGKDALWSSAFAYRIGQGFCVFTSDGLHVLERGSTCCKYRLELAVAEEEE
jgi:hypothetical protein